MIQPANQSADCPASEQASQSDNLSRCETAAHQTDCETAAHCETRCETAAHQTNSRHDSGHSAAQIWHRTTLALQASE